MLKSLAKCGLLCAAVLLSALSFTAKEKLPIPAPWALGLWTMGLLAAFFAAYARKEALQVFWIAAMSACLALGGGEFFLARKYSPPAPKRFEAESRAHMYKHDPVLGYAPIAKAMRHRVQSVTDDGDSRREVVYSTFESGWRVTPLHPGAETAVVFFGCSFTYGQGLNDEETFPWKVAEKLGEKYQVFNFALPGYGAHQMLAQAQNGFLDDIAAKYKKVFVFFTTIRGHKYRCAGFSDWDQNSPRYVPHGDGVRLEGAFADKPPTVADKIFKDSMIYRELNKPRENWREYLPLHLAIIGEARKTAREKYGLELKLAVWPGIKYAAILREKGIDYIDLAGVVPDMAANPARYSLPGDGHPNTRGTEAAALAFVRYILENK